MAANQSGGVIGIGLAFIDGARVDVDAVGIDRAGHVARRFSGVENADAALSNLAVVDGAFVAIATVPRFEFAFAVDAASTSAVLNTCLADGVLNTQARYWIVLATAGRLAPIERVSVVVIAIDRGIVARDVPTRVTVVARVPGTSVLVIARVCGATECAVVGASARGVVAAVHCEDVPIVAVLPDVAGTAVIGLQNETWRWGGRNVPKTTVATFFANLVNWVVRYAFIRLSRGIHEPRIVWQDR